VLFVIVDDGTDGGWRDRMASNQHTYDTMENPLLKTAVAAQLLRMQLTRIQIYFCLSLCHFIPFLDCINSRIKNHNYCPKWAKTVENIE
jgi:hypothetical protein